ncbi:MAG: hypothetical protein ACYSSP_02100 [Planctomycetota bacterium]|jgi:hypothetical protein
MDRSGRSLTKIHVYFFLLFSSLVFWPGFVLALVEPEDVNQLRESTRLVLDSFYQESFDLRMQYDYSGKFITTEHREMLKQIARDTSEKLNAVSAQQTALKKQVEDYEGQDWDDLYGKTGLWRKLSWDIHVTDLGACQTDYYLAITLEGTAKEELIEQLNERIIEIESSYITAGARLLKAKIFALLSRKDPRYKELALKELEVFMVYSDVERPVTAAVEKLKLIESVEAEQLNSLINILYQNRDERYLELVLSVAFLQRQYDLKGFERTIELFPEIEKTVGSFSLAELLAQFEENYLTLQKLQQKSVLEIELAALAAWEKAPESKKELLQNFLKVDKFKTPLVTYTAASSIAQSSPEQSIELLIEASRLQKLRESKRLSVSAIEIAEQAAWFAFSLFESDTSYCQITIRAFDNYFKIVGSSPDEELEYLHAVVLKDCGQIQKSKQLLKKIADNTEGQWRQKAIMELVVDSIRNNKSHTKEQNQALLGKIAPIVNDSNGPQYCDYAYDIKIYLKSLTDRIEQIEIEAGDSPSFVKKMQICAEFCYGCFENPEKYEAALLWGELLVLTNSKQSQKFSQLQDYINTSSQKDYISEIDMLRFQARLFMAEEQFSQAAEKWARICSIRKAESLSDKERSWKWWRAKFYELFCCRQIAEFSEQDLLHTIEILETTYQERPPLWSEKLNSLKK